MLYKLPNPDIKITFSDEEFAIHIGHLYLSLQQYESHYAPILSECFGTSWPKKVAYLCPICLKNLYVSSEIGSYSTSSFNLDHFPQKSVGGKLSVIVCEPCNNNAGRNFEPELQRFLSQQSFKSGNHKSNFKVDVDYNSRKKAKIFLTKNNTGEILLEPGIHNILNPDFQAWINKTGSGADQRPFTIIVNNAEQKKVCKSLVKTAYLYCFCLWGYEFAFSEIGRAMIKVLNDELTFPFPEGHAFILDKVIPDVNEGVCILDHPEFKRLVVLIPMIYEKEDYRSVAGVVIPSSMEDWENLRKTETKTLTANVKRISPFEINDQLKGYSLAQENLKS